MFFLRLAFFASLMLPVFCVAQIPTDSRFQTLALDETFQSEGAAVADIDRDGHNDIVSGPYWYRGPEFRTRVAYANVRELSIKNYSDHFFCFTDDFNDDGFQDVLTIPIPGGKGIWYENPGARIGDTKNTKWKSHVALESVDNESPAWADIVGDASPELVCIHQGNFGYAQPDSAHPDQPWKFTRISTDQNLGRFTHGLGVGDIDGDGRTDLLEKNGWWQQTDRIGHPFVFHPQRFAESGGSQMFAYDFDGDGDQDVLSAQNAHAYGLCWYERRGKGDDVLFVKHDIMGSDPKPDQFGLTISQLHAVALADIDGDGVKDIVTGKRYFAHGGKDPGAHQPAMLVWFRTIRNSSTVDFHPHVVHARSGVGTQVTVADVDQDGHNDVLVGNKLGTFLSLNSGKPGTSLPVSDQPVSLIGTDAFKINVRTTKPLAPLAERDTFMLPTGFEAQLVAAEPDIGKPMNMAFDARGRLWVSSSTEYPYAATDGRRGKDTIKILEDTDGNGSADKITTFADGLNIPIGLYPYKDGVICFSIPNIWFLRDTDGDDVADQRTILYGPMDTTRDTHGMCNSFRRGFDGWIYACHGFNNQTTVAGKDGHKVVMHSGNTFRFRPDGSRIEHFTHGQVNPFGMAFAPDGDLFSADCHTKPVSLLIQGGYYPSFGKPHDGVGFVPDVMQHLHGSTGIGGISFYNDNQFPGVFQGNSFGGNVMTGRINRNSIKSIGSTVRASEQADFLIAGDPWFRPVDLQLAHDGSLYVADFYNCIIGHYEVDLEHPDRDRKRGRIWRIAYKGNEVRRDTPSDLTDTAEATGRNDIATAIERLGSPSLRQRMMATDLLSDRFGEQSVNPMNSLLKSDRLHQRLHAGWVLHRLGRLTRMQLAALLSDRDSMVRNHAFRILAESDFGETEDLIRRGISDPDPMVRRSATLAATKHSSKGLVLPLLTALRTTDESDVHLLHATRMALRDHLTHAAWFRHAATAAPKESEAELMDLCIAIKTDFAGEHLAQRYAKMNDHELKRIQPEVFDRQLRFAAQYASVADVDSIANIARTRFAGDLEGQESLLRSIADGFRERGARPTESITSWATELAAARLGVDSSNPKSLPAAGVTPIVWTAVKHPKHGNEEPCWAHSTKRQSSDGQQGTLMHSSFPHGEKRTGVFRSGVFELSATFSFYIAGHDGFPNDPIGDKNFICVRDADTLQILNRWSPPRHDTARPINWITGDDSGRSVFVELVDGDTATAYAWLAVGRFSVAGLNPSKQLSQWQQAADLISEFKLESLKHVMIDLLRRPTLDRKTSLSVGKALNALNSSAVRLALAESFSIPGVAGSVRKRVVGQLISTDQSAVETLSEVMLFATEDNQRRLAQILSSDQAGVAVLIACVEKGRASARVLVDPKVRAKLSIVATAKQKRQSEQLTASLPKTDQTRNALVARHQEALREIGDRAKGGKLFAKQCAVCHQVAGQGKLVGPNLDGVGNRGLKRLIEDVFHPNQNIDVAFRASLVLTDDGKVHTGLAQESEGDSLTLIDQEGKSVVIAKSSIEKQTRTTISPMPANFAETLTTAQGRDLFAYLLSLTK